jgi:hypothetical protein
MARMTRKLERALIWINQAKLPIKPLGSHAEIYAAMEAACWKWDGSDWSKQDRPVTSSVFGDGETGSGIFHLRVMAHPAECVEFVSYVTETLRASGYKIAEVSEPYPNRRGVGTRVYITLAKGG